MNGWGICGEVGEGKDLAYYVLRVINMIIAIDMHIILF